ncbi:MAG: GT4 family glycosyltransferase PelF [Fervidobacterium nodosum]
MGVGGAENLVSNILEFSDSSKFDMYVIELFESNSFLVEKLKNKGFRIYSLISNIQKTKNLSLIKKVILGIGIIRKIYKTFREIKPEIVHTHLSGLKYVILPSLLCNVKAKVHTIHTLAEKDAAKPTRFFNMVGFKLFKFVPVSISNEIADSVKKLYGDKINTPVIYNGIDIQKFSTNKNDNKSKDKIILLNVGRLVKPKNQFLLIRAFNKAVQEFPNLELWIVGDGELKQELEDLVKNLSLEEKVRFLGVRSDIPELLKVADIFVMSSDYEGVPISLLEALASGVPVISTAVGGVPEILESGRAGILVTPKDEEELAQKIIELARDEKKRLEFSEYGKKLAKEKFDIRKTVEKYEKLYISLLDRKNKK